MSKMKFRFNYKMLFFTFHVLVTVVEAIVNARFVGVVEVPVSIYTVNNVKDKVYL
jgi:hypothetical protein